MGSRRSARSAPISSSWTVITDTNMLAAGALAAHSVTFLSARPALAFRSSETTFVSSRNINPGPPVGEIPCAWNLQLGVLDPR
jgi:hypothetical protein